jgi:hypothetical protein
VGPLSARISYQGVGPVWTRITKFSFFQQRKKKKKWEGDVKAGIFCVICVTGGSGRTKMP